MLRMISPCPPPACWAPSFDRLVVNGADKRPLIVHVTDDRG
jgi:hypothetical protein